eukprot:TRINITY_DN1032_c0_g1_i1.p1 TRINITY_DN1032_c0_g1~~TRINITY_DN1032_c0_g1_i1.p1  ORF type:complete len:219 (-),score=88.28 TRINITY_DN1032_c0_g1_i1:495-1151(-)
MSWKSHNSWRGNYSKDTRDDDMYEDYEDDDYKEEQDHDENETEDKEEQVITNNKISQLKNEEFLNPQSKKKKKKTPKKKTPLKEQQKEEVLPNNEEIKIVESNKEEIKTYLNFSPVHNSNMISWMQIKNNKNLPRSYFGGVLFKDKKGNNKILLHSGSDANGSIQTHQILDLTDLEIRNVSARGKEQSTRIGHTATLDHTGTKIIFIGGYTMKNGHMR